MGWLPSGQPRTMAFRGANADLCRLSLAATSDELEVGTISGMLTRGRPPPWSSWVSALSAMAAQCQRAESEVVVVAGTMLVVAENATPYLGLSRISFLLPKDGGSGKYPIVSSENSGGHPGDIVRGGDGRLHAVVGSTPHASACIGHVGSRDGIVVAMGAWHVRLRVQRVELDGLNSTVSCFWPAPP